MSFLSNYSPAGISAVKLMAYSLRSAPTADLVAAGTAFIQGGGTPAQILNSLFNANIPQSPFTAYGSAYSDGAFVSALIDNLAYGTTISVGTRSAWAASITPLVAQFATRGDAVMALTNMIEASNSTDPDLAMLKAGLLARAETAAAFAQSPAGATYSGQGFAQLLAPMSATLDPTYVLSVDASSVNEGGAVTYTLSTTHVAVGTMLAFTLGGTGIAASDIAGGAVTGNFTINAAGLGTATITLAADGTTEGAETMRLEMSSTGKFIDVLVNDTSVSGSTPTYALASHVTNQNEGASVNYTLTTTNVAAGTVVPFTLSGSGISAADIVGGSLSGSFTVNASGIGTATVALAADLSTEGMETLLLNLTGATGQLAVTINDTSLTGGVPVPTYGLTSNVVNQNEGASVIYTLTTTNVAAGTSVAFTLSGTGISAADIVGGSLSGSFTVTASGVSTATVALASDLSTEGMETLMLNLAGGLGQLAVSINDTSLTGGVPVPTYGLTSNVVNQDEGASVIYTLNTTNVAAGTVVAFTLSGTGISAADIVGGSLSGSFTVNASGVGTATVALASDLTTEGMENLLLSLAGGVAQLSVSVNDTSLTVPPVGTPDLLIIADNMPNGGASIPPTALLGEIGLSTYLSFDFLNQSGATPLRMSLADLIATNATAGAALDTTNHSADRGNIPQVSNQHLFTHDLGGMTDRVDYSAETGKIVSVIGATASTTQYVMVNDNGTNNVFNDATDRIDTLINVEELVASQGGGVLDLTNSGQDWLVTFSKNYSAATDIDAAKDRETHRVELSNLNTGVPSGRNYFDFRDAGANAGVTQATAAWTAVQGSDRNETLVFTGAESMDARTNTLRGGTNTVKFNELTRSILVDVTVADWLPSTNLADDLNTSGVITATTSFTNGDGVTLLSANTNVTSSHTANNGVAAGLLKVVGSQDAEDAVSFSDNAAAKLFILGQLIGGNDVITAKIGSGAAQNSLELTGFEFLRDNGASDDVYSIDNMVRAASGLKLTDALANDHDAIQIGNDALGSAAVGGVASIVNLATLNGAAPGFNFDFDVLDISLITGTGLSMVGTAGTDDELVLGTLGSLTAVSLFESLVLTSASLDKGSSLVLDLDTAAVRVGATKLFDYSGSSLSAGGLMFGTAGQTSYVGALAGGLTLAVLDSSAGAGATVMGGNGADTITGGAGNDTIRGGGGNDTVSGGATAESWTFTLGGTADAVAAAANRITVTMTVDGTVLTLTEAALADSTYGDGNGAVLDGASAIGIGDAMVGLINANLSAINAGAGTGTVTGATFNNVSGAVALNFAPGVNANDAVTFVLNPGAGPDGGSFTLSAGVNVNGNDAGVDTFVFEKTGALNGSDTLNSFAGASDKLNVTAFTGAAITAASASINAATGGTFAGVATTAEFVYNKAGGLVAVSDFATAAAAGKFVVADGTKFVLAVTADVTGALGDAANTAVSLYFVENGATAGLSDLTVSLVGTISGPAELSLAAIYGALT